MRHAKKSITPDSRAVSTGVALGLMAVALVLVFLLPADTFLCAPNTDMISGNISWRAYLVDSLRAGHLPLWDPYTYGGEPFLGGFEAGVLYPPNLLFLVLPLARAINFSILLHLILLGWGMERWASRRGMLPVAAGLMGFVVALSGAVYPHVYAGHLDGLCTMAWAPWILLGLERWWSRGEWVGLLLASAAASFQIFAGHIQYFFDTAVAAGLFALVATLAEPAVRRRALPAVAACYLAAMALGAAQLLPGFSASTEGVRQQKLEFAFAAMFGFAPENFLTLIAPEFFGGLGHPVYWGRCYLWEMTLFMGTAAPLLIAAALGDRKRGRQGLLDLAVATSLLVLALGVHTPLFRLLYDFAPGFGHFRGAAKFIFPATLFLALVMGAGVDLLLRGERVSRGVAWSGIGSGIGLAGAGFFLLGSPGLLAALMGEISASRESYLDSRIFGDPAFIHQAGFHAGESLILAALILSATGAVFLWAKNCAGLRWVVPALLVLEMSGFAFRETELSPFTDALPTGLRDFVASHPGDYRVLNVALPNNGFLLQAGDVSGNTPSVLRRYAEWSAFSQGENADHPSQYLNFHRIDPLDALIRLRYAFIPTEKGVQVAESPTTPLPHVLLVSDWNIPGDRDAIFSAMRNPAFDPQRTVLLEHPPRPEPDSSAIGTVKLLSALPDELTIEADTDKPTLLLITDLYARDWKAEALPGSVQQNYEILPADYILRAVPLAAGHHRLRVVYGPVSLTIGLVVSALAWLAWGGFLFWQRKR